MLYKTATAARAILLAAMCLSVNLAYGQPPQTEILNASVRVVDSEDYPIEGVVLSPDGVLSKGGFNPGWIGWPEDRFGQKPKVMTDEKGIARIPYPKYATEKFETDRLFVAFSHSDFVRRVEYCNVSEEPFVVRLERGIRIALSAVEAESGQPIKTDLFAVMSGSNPSSPDAEHWKLASSGFLVSPMYPVQPRQLRVMRIAKGKPNLYSANIDVGTDKPRVRLVDVELSLGTRVEGTIDQSVPRPIVSGHVGAFVIRQPELKNRFAGNQGPNKLNSCWVWGDKVEISEDGSFVFESLPTGEVLQLIAICKGYVPQQPTNSQLEEFFPSNVDDLDSGRTLPHFVKLTGDTVKTEIKMRKSTSLRMEFQTVDGNPIEGVEVKMWPNNSWLGYGNNVLGASHSTAQSLVGHRDSSYKHVNNNRFVATSDENGIAIIDELPVDCTQSIMAQHTEFRMPVENGYRRSSAELKSGEVAEVVIVMEKKEEE